MVVPKSWLGACIYVFILIKYLESLYPTMDSWEMDWENWITGWDPSVCRISFSALKVD